jgi:hypothetical protein
MDGAREDDKLHHFIGTLLDAGRSEEPANIASGRKRTLAALGLGSGMIVSQTTALAAVRAGALASYLKGFAVCAVGGALATAAATAISHHNGVTVQSAPVYETVRAVEIVDPPPVETARAEATAPAAPAVTAAQAMTKAPSAPAKSAAKGVTLPPLADELRAIDGARAALASGDAALCLRQLDHYDHDFPNARLRTEATVLRIRALVKHGDRAAAVRLAEAFSASHPQSPYRRAVRSAVGLDPSAASP